MLIASAGIAILGLMFFGFIVFCIGICTIGGWISGKK